MYRKHVVSRSLYVTTFFSILSACPSMKFPEPWMVGGCYGWPIHRWALAVTHAWCFDQLWVSALTHRKRSSMAKAESSTDLCLWTYYSECSLTAWSFSKTATVSYSIGPVISSHGLLIRCTVPSTKSLLWCWAHMQSEDHCFTPITIIPILHQWVRISSRSVLYYAESCAE